MPSEIPSVSVGTYIMTLSKSGKLFFKKSYIYFSSVYFGLTGVDHCIGWTVYIWFTTGCKILSLLEFEPEDLQLIKPSLFHCVIMTS